MNAATRSKLTITGKRRIILTRWVAAICCRYNNETPAPAPRPAPETPFVLVNVQLSARDDPKMKPQPLATWQLRTPAATPVAADAGAPSTVDAPAAVIKATAIRVFVLMTKFPYLRRDVIAARGWRDSPATRPCRDS